MKKIVISLTFLLSISSINGQTNLVPNPSFELHDTCYFSYGTINHALGWYSPTSGTTDYFNSCSITNDFGVPNNLLGFQNARTGNAYAGIGCYYIAGTSPQSYREYLQRELTDTLIANKTYKISFYINLIDTIGYINWGRIAISEIGIYLSSSAVYSTGHYVLPYQPQVSSPTGIYLTDTANWVEVSGNYTAMGGEKYITIGNFKNDTITDTVIVEHNNSNIYVSYYYIDDVSVTECENCHEGVAEIKSESNFTILPNPNDGILQIKNENYAIKNITITNVLGESVYSAITNQFQINLNLPNLPSGVYFVSCLINNKTVVKKFIKE